MEHGSKSELSARDGMNRRDFMVRTGTLGAGLALAGPAWAQSESTQPAATESDEMIRVGLIGAGLQGETLMSACFDTWEAERVQVKAVCDVWESLNLRRMMEALGKYGQEARAYTDYRQMLEQEKELDAVIVATPDHCHADQAVACLEAGLHVYCEAPLSNTLEGGQRLVKAARETGKLLQVGYQRRSNPKYVHSWDKLLRAARLLGKVTAVNGQTNHSAQSDLGWSRRRALSEDALKSLGYPSMHAFKNWRWYHGLGGGPLLDYGAHQIDVFNWFMGALPHSVTARGGTHFYDAETHQWQDTVMAVLEYETRQGIVTAQYQILTSNGYGGKFEAFLGEEGSLELSESPSRGGVYRDPNAADWDKWVQLEFLRKPGQEEKPKAEEGTIQAKETQPPAKYEIPIVVTDPHHTAHLSNFFDAVQGQGTLNCPAEVAYGTLVTVAKINEAMATGKTLELDPAAANG